MRIVVLDGKTLNPGDNPWHEVEAQATSFQVHERTTPDKLLERARDADILLTNKTRLSAEALAQLPKLKFVGALATGYDVIDVAACAARGIPVSNVPGYGTESVAQHVFALLLSLTNAPADHDAEVHAGQWGGPEWCFWLKPIMELSGKTMGLVGLGDIARRVAALAHAFGMTVVAHKPRPPHPADALPYPGFQWLSLEELFARSDVVSLHCPLKDNAGFVNADLLLRMKPTSFLINTARGALVNEADLAAALEDGVLAGAGVDVVSEEPIRPNNPLLGAPNCIITPHMAWASLEARQRLMAITAANVRAFLAGKPHNVVNGVAAAKA